jgi:hypothetical protein
LEILKIPLIMYPVFIPIPLEPTPILTFPLRGKGQSPLPLQGGGWEGDGLIHSPLKGEVLYSLPFKGRVGVGMGK